MAFCPYCGSEIAESAKFCTQCGARLTQSVPVQGGTGGVCVYGKYSAFAGAVCRAE